MTIPSNPQERFTPFLISTYNLPEEDDRLRTWLGEVLTQFSDVINDKKIGTIAQATENYSGGGWRYKVTGVNRSEFQTIAYIPSLPGPASLPVPNQITIGLTGTPQYPITNVNNQLVITQLYGTASLPPTSVGAGDGDYFSYMPQGDSRISFSMSDLQIIITSTVDLSAYSGFIVINYLRNGV